MNGGAPSGAGMASGIGMTDSTTQGFMSLGDQGDPMKMASSGAAMPGANPAPSNGLNAQPTLVPSSASTMLPTAQRATALTNDQVARILAYMRSRAQGQG